MADLRFTTAPTPAEADRCVEVVYGAFKEVGTKHSVFLQIAQSEAHARAVIEGLLNKADAMLLVGLEDAPAGAAEGEGGAAAAVPEAALGSPGAVVCCAGIRRFGPRSFGVGPLAVNLCCQGHGLAARLMRQVYETCTERARMDCPEGGDPGPVSLRLLVNGWNIAALGLYMKSGYTPREFIAGVRWCRSELAEDTVPANGAPNLSVEPFEPDDLQDCLDLCSRLSGVRDLGLEASAAALIKTRTGSPVRVVRSGTGKLMGYGTGLGFQGRICAVNLPAVQALLLDFLQHGQDPEPTFLLPTIYGDLVDWVMARAGARIVTTLVVMSLGPYSPLAEASHRGVYLPTVVG